MLPACSQSIVDDCLHNAHHPCRGAIHGYIIYCSAQATKRCSNSLLWNVVGGASVSTPLWAVLAVLSNEMSQKQGGPRLGFLNPLLYKIASDPHKYRACFHDITTGNNDYNGLNHGRYPATAGYDMATGLGSYNAYALAVTSSNRRGYDNVGFP